MSSLNEIATRFLTPKPKEVEGLNNTSYFYYSDMLFNKLLSIFKLENIPDTWDEQYIFENLFRNGVVGVCDTNIGVLALQCGFSGTNVYNKPTHIVISNHVVGNLTKAIGSEAELVYMARFKDKYFTLNDLVKRYALLLSQIDGSLNTTLMNSRVAMVFEANSTAQLKTMQKVYDKVSYGQPAVFINKNGEAWSPNHLFNNVKQTYIGQELLDTKRTIINEFLTEIGINNANTDKRERLNADEVNANNKEVMANIYVWQRQLQKCFDKVNSLFDYNIKIVINEDVMGGEKDEPLQLDGMDE